MEILNRLTLECITGAGLPPETSPMCAQHFSDLMNGLNMNDPMMVNQSLSMMIAECGGTQIESIDIKINL